MRFFLPFLALVLLGTGCATSTETTRQDDENLKKTSSVTFPIDDYLERRSKKAFGEYIEDRFRGYHVGDDIEYTDIATDVPVYAIADGTVVLAQDVNGYGGLIAIEHSIDGELLTALYGHLDLSASPDIFVGTSVTKGQRIAILGDHETQETDWERKHLHFALAPGPLDALAGYETTARGVDAWLNPQTLFSSHQLTNDMNPATFLPATDLGGSVFPISFSIPSGWAVEYVPSIESLNLFTLDGEGTARERSQMFIRYFDATDFLTLSTVTIYRQFDTTVGKEFYTARTYEIEKNRGVPDFRDQPTWRNERHFVTDFRTTDGYTRYFVVGVNPLADETLVANVFDSFLSAD